MLGNENQLGFKVLIVDDSEPNVVVLSKILESNGFTVEKCFDGEEALIKVKDFDPDIILLDIQMPLMDGLEVGNALQKTEYADIPIIFISGTSEIVDKIKAFEAGGVDFVTKPFDRDELLARIRTHLMLKTLEEESKQQLNMLKERENEMLAANEKKYRLLRMISHDIKNPLSGILGLIDVIQLDDSMEKEDLKPILDLINESGQKLLDVVKEKLDAEIRELEQTEKLAKIDLVKILKNVILTNYPKATLKKIDLKSSFPDQQIMGSFDDFKLYDILNSLIGALIKHMDKNGSIEPDLEMKEDSISLFIDCKSLILSIQGDSEIDLMSDNTLKSDLYIKVKEPLGLKEIQRDIQSLKAGFKMFPKSQTECLFEIELSLRNT